MGDQIGIKNDSKEEHKAKFLSCAEFRYQPRGGQINGCMAWCINNREVVAHSAICDRHTVGSINTRYARMNATNDLIKIGVQVRYTSLSRVGHFHCR